MYGKVAGAPTATMIQINVAALLPPTMEHGI
jgi:hypothetical protein